MKNKLLLLIVLVALFVCVFAISSSAVEVDGLYYSLNDTEKTATLTNENVNCTLETVNIPETITPVEGGMTYTVTAIDAHAFSGSQNNWTGNKTIKNVTIPKTVASIGNHVFRNCSALETVVIEATGYNYETGEGNSEISFSNAEFYCCTSLVSVDMSKSNVVSLGQYCFTSCGKLTTVLFSAKIKSIGASFTSCSSLATINVEALESLESISTGFFNTIITGDIKLPNIETIGSNAFRGTGITSVDMTGAPITKVGDHAFNDCKSLTTVVLPEGLKTIDSEAFLGCGAITSINLPVSLEAINYKGLNGVNAISELYLPNLTTLGSNVFQNSDVKKAYLPKLQTVSNDTFHGSQLQVLVVSNNVDGFNSKFLDNTGKLRLVICIGENAEALQSSVGGLSQFTIKSFNEYDTSVDYASGSDKIIFDGLSLIEADKYICFNGFDKAFSTWNYITNEKADYGAILTHSGYSVSPDGTGIASGFSVNQQSLAIYEGIFGKVSYGVVIFNPASLGENTVFADGKINATAGAIQVSIGTAYANTSVYVNGFDLTQEKYQKLELVFAGYMYVDGKMDTTLELIQKEYNGTEESPVTSPMATKVVRDYTLYTVKFDTVKNMTQITTGKDGLNDYVAPTITQ